MFALPALPALPLVSEFSCSRAVVIADDMSEFNSRSGAGNS